MPTLREIYNALNRLAPWDLAETWDNSGLQVGQTSQKVKKILLAVDFNQSVMEEGLKNEVDGYLVHHPLIFKPLSQINLATPLGSHLSNLIRNNQFLISAHTNIDNAAEGINQYLAVLLGLQEIDILQKISSRSCKIIVFVPENYLEQVRQSMAEAGAGNIGDYQQCAFISEGTGFFIPNNKANPFIGQPGKMENVSEIRLEMIAPQSKIKSVISALLNTHPYEKPSYDIYPLLNPSEHGLGRIGVLPQSLTVEKLGNFIKDRFKAEYLRISGDKDSIISKLALCSGSGKSLITNALTHQADAYLTSDLTYHDFCEAKERNLVLIDIGHYTSEKFFIPLLSDFLSHEFQEQLEIITGDTLQNEPYQLF